MKNKLLSILLSGVIAISCIGCQNSTQQTTKASTQEISDEYFTIIDYWVDSGYCYKILVANDTKVKYLIIYGYEHDGELSFTPLYNSDGSLQIYDK
jgi:hypothetical protein